jgi:LysR family transcriptional regulator, hydrogen peroxide-inducible genes activator
MDYAPVPFTLRQLQYAVAVAEVLSFRKAAERCHVSQPSLSAQIGELESGLRVRLFERDRRRVLVTSAGELLLPRLRRALQEAEDLVSMARQASDPLTATLRLGVIPTISPYLLPRISAAVRRAHPRLVLRWVEDKTAVLVERLDGGSLDAVLLALEADVGDVEHEVVGHDPFVLATAEHHPLGGRRGPARTIELREADVLLLDEGHCFREQALSYCSSARARELEFRATSLPTLVQMVADGSGVTLLPQMAVPLEASRARLRIRPFARPAPGRTIALVWRRRSPLGPAMRTLAATLRKAYATPPRGRRGVSRRAAT